MVRLSLRARVLAGMALVGVVLGVVALIVTTTTRAQLVDQVDARLEVAGGPQRDGRRDGGDEFPSPPQPGPGDDVGADRPSDLYVGAFSSDRRLETYFESNLSVDGAGGPDVDLERAGAEAGAGPFTVRAVDDADMRYRVRTSTSPDGAVYVTALPLTDVDDTIERLVLVEVVATAIIVVVLGAVTWWVVRLGIRPIKQMTRTATQIAAGDLSLRVPSVAPSTEAGELGVALNHMLERLDVAFTERAESQARLHQFVADASHELRTPVTTIRGYAELYRVGGLAERSELDEAMRRTEQEAVRMARLVDDLLNLAKLDQGRPLERRPVELTGLVADAARDAAAVDPDRSIHTNLDGPVVVSGAEDRLRQVIANIVGNALVHTPVGTPIEMSVRRSAEQARVAISDRGPGMAPDVAARVMQRFYRADPARARDRGGSGLGMSIADAAVAAHGGEISVVSQIGHGTTVTVTLPLAGNSAR